MASVSLPTPRSALHPLSLGAGGHSVSAHSRRCSRMSAPLPNPPFTFPAQDPKGIDSQNVPTESQSRTPPPLPVFSFNPSEGRMPQPFASTPTARGHRRQYSELIGADRIGDNETTSSTHSTGKDLAAITAKLQSSTPSLDNSGRGRRGHAHRRSGAVSSVDFLTASKLVDIESSTQNSPKASADVKQHQSYVEPTDPRPYPHTGVNLFTPPASPTVSAIYNSSASMAQKLDKNFSPSGEQQLLLAESKGPEPIADCPGDAAKGNHRFSERDQEFTHRSELEARPKTADALFAFDRDGATASDDIKLERRPTSAAGHYRANRSLSSGVLELALKRMKPAEYDSRLHTIRRSSDTESSDASVDDADDSNEPLPTTKNKLKSKEKEKRKKQSKKVRSWAGAILTLNKGKQPKRDVPDNEHSESPPEITRTSSNVGSGLDVNFDDDNVVILRTPTNPSAPEPSESGEASAAQALQNSWKPRSFYRQAWQDDLQSPVIDLDAALGPFNTPEMRPGFIAGSSFSAATRHMYSGGRRGEFVGPEMRYHRRTESAPEMTPFDLRFMTGNRLTTTSAMEDADVFYEEEEDAFLAASGQPLKDSSISRPSQSDVAQLDSVDCKSAKSTKSSDTLTRRTAGCENTPHNTGLGIHKNISEKSSCDPISSNQEDSRVFGMEDVAEQIEGSKDLTNQSTGRFDTARQEEWQEGRRSKAPVPSSPGVSPGFLPVEKRSDTSVVGLGPEISYMSLQDGRSLPSYSFPSPSFNNIPDVPRPITTPSTTDRNLSRFSFSAGADQQHPSFDDVPSLSNSVSTVATRMRRLSASFLQHARRSGDRPLSFSAGAAQRNSQANSSNRSSFASLSRLTASPRGEQNRSPDEEKSKRNAEEEAKRKDRGVSRLMQFFRMKGKHKPGDNGYPG